MKLHGIIEFVLSVSLKGEGEGGGNHSAARCKLCAQELRPMWVCQALWHAIYMLRCPAQGWLAWTVIPVLGSLRILSRTALRAHGASN